VRDDPVISPVASTATVPAGRLAVLYDRDCGLCTATARRLRGWDREGRLDVVPLQSVTTAASPEVARLAAGRSLGSALHVIDPASGRVLSGGDSVLAIARRLPGGSVPAAVIAGVPPARWALALGYDLVARNRHRIGRWLRLEGPACDVPR
jgi:predicted DCC family thiol-disulfide oxidoreductase YuxK